MTVLYKLNATRPTHFDKTIDVLYPTKALSKKSANELAREGWNVEVYEVKVLPGSKKIVFCGLYSKSPLIFENEGTQIFKKEGSKSGLKKAFADHRTAEIEKHINMTKGNTATTVIDLAALNR